jgi:hypothetical protein
MRNHPAIDSTPKAEVQGDEKQAKINQVEGTEVGTQ